VNEDSLVRAVRSKRMDCDSALESHLDAYRGSLTVPSFSEVHLALCCANMGWRDREVGPMKVSAIIEAFNLGAFLPLFDRQDDASFAKGEIVRYGNEHWSYTCRVIGRREVTLFASLRLDVWELFLESLDGETTGFVGESEVEAVE
jgi:hypothetical protein